MTSFLSEEQIAGGWWRLPFVIGACAAVVALWLRSHLHETTSRESREDASAGSFLEILVGYPRPFLVVLGITAAGSLAFYTFTTYMQKYLINTGGFAKADVADAMTLCLLAFMVIQPAVGALSDRIGRKNSMLVFALGMVALPVPLFGFLQGQASLWACAGAILVAMFFLSFYTSVSGIVKAEMFPAHVRGLGVGFTYAIANSLFGGSAEYVALGLKDAGAGWVFPWYVTAMAALGWWRCSSCGITAATPRSTPPRRARGPLLPYASSTISMYSSPQRSSVPSGSTITRSGSRARTAPGSWVTSTTAPV